MEKQRRGKRESQVKQSRHPLRTLLIVLCLAALAAAAAFKWGLPLWQERTAQPEAGAVSGEPEDEPPVLAQPEDEAPEAPPPEDQAETPPDPEELEPDAEEPLSEPGPAANAEDDLLMLINADNPLPEVYTVELTELSNGQSVATVIYPALQQMFDDARADGVYPIVASGFRTAEKQQSLMDEKIQSFLAQGYSQEGAEAEALKWVNAVGCSEHQSGLAVDINADGIHSAGYEVYAWLAENAWRYGFILRYPEGKTDITGTDYEPWHYRYVGTQAAEEIYSSGVCLEEYLDAA